MKKDAYFLIIVTVIFLFLAGAGTVHAQYIEVDPPSLGFMGVPMSTSAVQTVTVTNTGPGNAELISIAITFNPWNFEVVSAPALPHQLASGESVDVEIRFTAGSPSPVSGILNISSNSSITPSIDVMLMGVGSMYPTDFDGDGVSSGLYGYDNCPYTPNGPDLGTCISGNVGEDCTSDDACGGVGESCIKDQRDSDGDGIGDVCEGDWDNDDISDTEEDGCPNDGDGNNDGSIDSVQPDVASFLTYDEGHYLTLVSVEGITLIDVEAIENPASPEPLPMWMLGRVPYGFFKFTVKNIEEGAAVIVTLIHHDPSIEIAEYIKYGPESCDGTIGFYTFDYHMDDSIETGAQIDGNTIILHFVDGQRGDFDCLANSAVMEPGATVISGVPEQNSAPSAPGNVEVTPAQPTTDDPLTCEIKTASTDPDNDPVWYVYRWTCNNCGDKPAVENGPKESLTDDLDSNNTAKGEHWTCEVWATDSFTNSDSVTTSPVTIENSPPEGLSAQVAPDPNAYVNDDLLCTASGVTDKDGDIISYRYEWKKGSVTEVTRDFIEGKTSDTLEAFNTNQNETWSCVVKAKDTSGAEKLVTAEVRIPAEVVDNFEYSANAPTLGDNSWYKLQGYGQMHLKQEDPNDPNSNHYLKTTVTTMPSNNSQLGFIIYKVIPDQTFDNLYPKIHFSICDKNLFKIDFYVKAIKAGNEDNYFLRYIPQDPNEVGWKTEVFGSYVSINIGTGSIDPNGREKTEIIRNMDADLFNATGFHYLYLKGIILRGDVDYLDDIIVSSIGVSVEMNLQRGWSMISLPRLPENGSVSSLFPDAVVVYGYEKGKGYVRINEGKNLEIGRGYWILLDGTKTFSISGERTDEYNLSVQDGWYMIGGCTSDAKASVDNGSIRVIYGYEQGFGYKRIQEGENLKSGKGYWIQFIDVGDRCELTVEEATGSNIY